MLKKSTK